MENETRRNEAPYNPGELPRATKLPKVGRGIRTSIILEKDWRKD